MQRVLFCSQQGWSSSCLPLVTLLRCHRPAPCVCSRALLLESDPSSVRLRSCPLNPCIISFLGQRAKHGSNHCSSSYVLTRVFQLGTRRTVGARHVRLCWVEQKLPGIEESLFRLIGWKQQPSGAKDIVRRQAGCREWACCGGPVPIAGCCPPGGSPALERAGRQTEYFSFSAQSWFL